MLEKKIINDIFGNLGGIKLRENVGLKSRKKSSTLGIFFSNTMH